MHRLIAFISTSVVWLDKTMLCSMFWSLAETMSAERRKHLLLCFQSLYPYPNLEFKDLLWFTSRKISNYTWKQYSFTEGRRIPPLEAKIPGLLPSSFDHEADWTGDPLELWCAVGFGSVIEIIFCGTGEGDDNYRTNSDNSGQQILLLTSTWQTAAGDGDRMQEKW